MAWPLDVGSAILRTGRLSGPPMPSPIRLKGIDVMDRKAVGTHQRSGVPAVAGTIVHSVIAAMLTNGVVGPNYVDDADRRVRTLTAHLGASLNAKRIRALALTSICKYISLLRPTSAEFIGAEVVLETGRADLLWNLANGDVFIDELKTDRYLQEAAAVAQATRYVTAGVDYFGDGFAGVRIVSTTQERRSLLVAPDFTVSMLSQSPLAFKALRTPVAVAERTV